MQKNRILFINPKSAHYHLVDPLRRLPIMLPKPPLNSKNTSISVCFHSAAEQLLSPSRSLFLNFQLIWILPKNGTNSTCLSICHLSVRSPVKVIHPFLSNSGLHRSRRKKASGPEMCLRGETLLTVRCLGIRGKARFGESRCVET